MCAAFPSEILLQTCGISRCMSISMSITELPTHCDLYRLGTSGVACRREPVDVRPPPPTPSATTPSATTSARSLCAVLWRHLSISSSSFEHYASSRGCPSPPPSRGRRSPSVPHLTLCLRRRRSSISLTEKDVIVLFCGEGYYCPPLRIRMILLLLEEGEGHLPSTPSKKMRSSFSSFKEEVISLLL